MGGETHTGKKQAQEAQLSRETGGAGDDLQPPTTLWNIPFPDGFGEFSHKHFVIFLKIPTPVEMWQISCQRGGQSLGNDLDFAQFLFC